MFIRMSHRLVLAMLLTGLMHASAEAVPLHQRDLFAPGDGYLTYDPATRFEWLNLNLTTGLSWNDIHADVGGWRSLGFRHAGFSEALSLWLAAGFEWGTSELYAGSSVGDTYLELTAATVYDPVMECRQYAILDWTHPSVPDGHVMAELIWYGVPPMEWILLPGTMRSQPDHLANFWTGHFLFRESKNVPDTGFTFGLLLFSVMILTLMKRGGIRMNPFHAAKRFCYPSRKLVIVLILLASGHALNANTEQLPPIQEVKLGPNREFRVNGEPFFPLMSWCQSTHRFAYLRTLGFNTFAGNFSNKPEASNFCDLAEASGGYALPFFDAVAKGHSALLAYMHGDEPDLGFRTGEPRRPAEDVVADYNAWKLNDDSRPILLNVTGAFMEGPSWAAGKTLAEKQAYYGVIVNGSDMMSFDVYPTYGWNRPDKLYWVADGVTQLQDYAKPHRPVFAFIETSKGSNSITYENQHDVTPEMTRAQVWMAIVRGATGIAYFTHAWQPTFTEFAPTVEMRNELQRLNGQITRLAPAILRPPSVRRVSIALTQDLPGEVMARDYEGHLYIVANNLDMERRAATATVTVPGLKAGAPIEVVDEDRVLVAEEGAFTDNFDPIGVHIYKIPHSDMGSIPKPPADLRSKPIQ